MDFGIARALASGATTMTQTSAVIGTAQYLSPEQARGEAVDARSDVYAAGCVLFELLVGHPPFVGDSPVSVAYQHVREEPKAPGDINPDVPRDVDAIVLKALAKNPVNRYQSAQEMRADALRAVAGRPVMATPVMTEAETLAMQGPPRQQWQPQTAATTLQRPIPMGPPRQPERRSSSWVMAVLAGLGVLVVVVLGVALAMSRNNDTGKNGGGGDATNQVATHQMPKLIGNTDQQARQLLDQQNLKNVSVDQPRTDKDCNGTVDKQDPQPGTTVREDQEISYRICLPPDQVTVPDDLVGANKDNADTRLRALGLKPDFVSVSSAQPLNQVIDVESAGDKVDPGSTITVKVSNANKVKVPPVIGQSQETAEALLAQAGPFNVSIEKVFDATKTPGIVVDQDPKANTTAEKGDTVTITVVVAPSPSDSASADPGTGGAGGGQVIDNALVTVRRQD
jgi:serine/threonine-protein kinase